MLRRCDDCGREYDRRRGPGKRCEICQPIFERERHRLAEEERRRRNGVGEQVRHAADPDRIRTFDDGWLAGFAAGEGCFSLSADMRPSFTVTLRDDDSAILAELRAAFGGSLTWRANDRGHEQCVWCVTAKQDVALLVAYLDRHPLRAKKQNDYVIWREAVSVYCRRGRTAPELPALAAALRIARKYDTAPAARLRVVS